MSHARRRFFVTLVAVLLVAPRVAADEGWVIERLDIRLDIQRDGSVQTREAIDVDFRGLARHGIYRDVAYLSTYDAEHDREYEIGLASVTDAAGRPRQVKSLTNGAFRRFQIGDPDRTVSGKETYRIAYRIGGALNGFADRDELYWNATGTWSVVVEAASIVVTAPGEAIERVQCFQGAVGSAEPCDARFTPGEATFTATRPLGEGEQITIATALRKGAVAEPHPLLVSRPRDITRFFDRTPGLLVASFALLAAAFGGIGALWWRTGRDRRYVSVYYRSHDEREERVPLLGSDPIAVEFEPPDGIRPGQMGLLFDERADTLDVTATIIDLAVRGHLKITELPKAGWFGHADWQLDRVKPADARLLEYERIVLKGLFDSKDTRKLSQLKNTFYDDLAKARKALYADAIERKWFPRNPNTVRTLWRMAGLLAIPGGIALTVMLGARWGAGLLGLPLVAAGVALVFGAGAMPRRSAAGREALRRALGFARYIKTAEQHQQAFAERANIFTAYLPYAIAMKCVEKWANAFKDIDLTQATTGWYAGTTAFNPSSFSSSVGSFSSSVSSAIASTPGGSGGSGFSGGSSGGGGGGGGGGSW